MGSCRLLGLPRAFKFWVLSDSGSRLRLQSATLGLGI